MLWKNERLIFGLDVGSICKPEKIQPVKSDRNPPSSTPKNMSTLRLNKFAFLRFARGNDFLDRFDQRSIDEAKSMGADVLVFCDRPWMGETLQLSLSDRIEIGLLSFDSFDGWFSNLERHARQEIRTPSKRGVEINGVKEPSILEAQQILDLFRESPLREGRYFEGYHSWNLKKVMETFKTNEGIISITAIYDGKIVGVARVKFKGQVAAFTSLLSSLAVRRKVKYVANLLLATQVRMLSDKGVKHLQYGKMGVLGGLDLFKRSNGFRPVSVNYNYLLLTGRARLLAKFGLYQPRDLLFSTKLRSFVPLLGSVQPHLPIKIIQKLHLYA